MKMTPLLARLTVAPDKVRRSVKDNRTRFRSRCPVKGVFSRLVITAKMPEMEIA